MLCDFENFLLLDVQNELEFFTAFERILKIWLNAWIFTNLKMLSHEFPILSTGLEMASKNLGFLGLTNF